MHHLRYLDRLLATVHHHLSGRSISLAETTMKCSNLTRLQCKRSWKTHKAKQPERPTCSCERQSTEFCTCSISALQLKKDIFCHNVSSSISHYHVRKIRWNVYVANTMIDCFVMILAWRELQKTMRWTSHARDSHNGFHQGFSTRIKYQLIFLIWVCIYCETEYLRVLSYGSYVLENIDDQMVNNYT